MYLEDVAMILEAINSNDSYLINQDGKELDKNDIYHLCIIHDMSPEEYQMMDEEQPKKGGRKKKVVEVETEEEINDSSMDQTEEEKENVSLDDESKLSIICKKYKINEMSDAVRKSNGWWVVPIMDNMTALRPLRCEKIKTGFNLILCNPLISCDPADFTDSGINWKFDSWTIISKLFDKTGTSRFRIRSIFRNKRERNKNMAELRVAVNQLQLAQKTRIKAGNNLISIARRNMGGKDYTEIKEQEAKEKGLKDEKEVKIIDMIMKEYDDIMADAHILKKTPNRRNYEKNFKEGRRLIPTYTTFQIATIYRNYLETEKEAEKMVEYRVTSTPLWKLWLSGVKGCGTTIAGYIMSYLDIYVAVHPSGFMRYLGLDQVAVAADKGESDKLNEESFELITKLLYRDIEIIAKRSKHFNMPVNKENWMNFTTDTLKTFNEYCTVFNMYNTYNIDELVSMGIKYLAANCQDYLEIVAKVFYTYQVMEVENSEGELIPVIVKRARRKGADKVYSPFINKDGKIKYKFSMGYNSAMKGKMLGVLFPCFLKSKSPYADIYNEYKERVKNRPDMILLRNQGKRGIDGLIHNMARRYTMQRFVEDLWINWRRIENLPLNGGTYAEGKLGIVHKQGYKTNPVAKPMDCVSSSDIEEQTMNEGVTEAVEITKKAIREIENAEAVEVTKVEKKRGRKPKATPIFDENGVEISPRTGKPKRKYTRRKKIEDMETLF